MMQFVIQKLLADAGVAAIVGRKVYPQTAPQTAVAPYVTCQLVSNVPDRCREGIASEQGLIQVNAIAPKYKQCHQLYLAIRQALDGAAAGDITCEWVDERDLHRQQGDAHGKAIDFKLIKG